MEENDLKKEEADALTLRIIDRLGERQRKMDLMRSFDIKEESSTPHVGTRIYGMKRLLMGVAIAACVAGIIVLIPWSGGSLPVVEELGIEKPTMTEYRAASPNIAEIERLMASEQFQEAAKLAEQELKQSDLTIHEFEGVVEELEDEEMAYEQEAEKVKNSELRWTYIYLLLKTNKKKEARRQLKIYLNNQAYGSHIEEARKLMKEI